MEIGVPREVKDHEFRIGMIPAVVRAFVEQGHIVKVETGLGAATGFLDAQYVEVGAQVVATAREAYTSEIVVKVKEPIKQEYELLKEGQTLFCFLHLAAEPELTQVLIDKNIVAIAYETVEDVSGRLPLLMPMSEIAGRISVQVGATALQMISGGKGILLGGVPGVAPARVVIIGGGFAGTEAARMAMGLGAQVTVIDKDINRLRTLELLFGPNLSTLYSTTAAIEKSVASADLVIGCVLIPGKKAPLLVTRSMIQSMAPGSVVVDVAIDQGGCFETSRPTTHTKPIYIEEGVVHYCVTNMPGACSRTATQALNNATMDYILRVVNKGYRKAFAEDKGLMKGLNVYKGNVTNENVALDLGYPYVSPDVALKL